MTKSDSPMVREVTQAGVHEAKTRLSQLLRLVESGGEVEITRSNVPVARLIPARSHHRRELGMDYGVVAIADDFDAPLPADVAALFES